MDVRKKLAELIVEAKRQWDGGTNNIDARIADHLIANGVTVQEWISVKDRLPEKHTDVLVCQTNGKVLKGWLGSADRWFAPGIVTHWCELPQPPKGE